MLNRVDDLHDGEEVDANVIDEAEGVDELHELRQGTELQVQQHYILQFVAVGDETERSQRQGQARNGQRNVPHDRIKVLLASGICVQRRHHGNTLIDTRDLRREVDYVWPQRHEQVDAVGHEPLVLTRGRHFGLDSRMVQLAGVSDVFSHVRGKCLLREVLLDLGDVQEVEPERRLADHINERDRGQDEDDTRPVAQLFVVAQRDGEHDQGDDEVDDELRFHLKHANGEGEADRVLHEDLRYLSHNILHVGDCDSQTRGGDVEVK